MPGQASKASMKQLALGYGSDAAGLEGWQQFCRDLNIEAGDSIKQCKQIRRLNINIRQFLEAKENDERVVRFASRSALRQWTVANKSTFPLKVAKQNKYLAALLIELF